MTEIRRQRTEVRRQKTEDGGRGQRSDDRGQRAEDGDQRSGDMRWVLGGWREHGITSVDVQQDNHVQA